MLKSLKKFRKARRKFDVVTRDALLSGHKPTQQEQNEMNLVFFWCHAFCKSWEGSKDYVEMVDKFVKSMSDRPQ